MRNLFAGRKEKIYMAGTIIKYVEKYGDCPLSEMPLSDVDSLVLCQLAYLKFDGMVCDVRENGPAVSLKEIAARADVEKLFADERYEKVNKELFAAAVAGRRFCNMKLNCYINLVEKEWETQFSAVTFLLEDGTIYIAFRGTDETIVGWKEDFNMAFLSPVPGQAYSVKYLNMVMSRLHKRFYIGGHSKGGNFAVYSAMKCIPEVQQRIVKVYSMDGPGFRPEVLKECGYEKIVDRVVKIIPRSSLVGMLFEKDIRFRTVESKYFGLAQHNPYNWLVEEEAFVEADDIYESRRFMDNTINAWIRSLDEQKLKSFVNTLFQLIAAAQADDLIAFMADWKKSMSRIRSAWKEMDEQTEEILHEIFKSLFEIAKIQVKEEVTQGMSHRKNHRRHQSRRKAALKQQRRMELE